MLKRIARFFLVLLGLFLALILFLAGSVVVDGLAGANRLAAITNTLIPGGSGNSDVRAFVARPQGSGPFPVVIMVHEFFGLNESIVGKAEGLAQEGYIVVAPDTFRGSTTAWIPRAIYQTISTPPARINQDLDTVFAWLEQQPDIDRERIAVIGFCYGGRASLAYSLHNERIAATVVFYGSPETDPNVLKALPGPLLGIFGEADNSIPLEEVRAFETGLQTAQIPHEITIYPGQPHAFVTSIEAVRAGGAPGAAWAQMVSFLEKNLKSGHSGSLMPDKVEYTPAYAWRYYARLLVAHTFEMHAH
jgi:carboxymethylenebutenolidase